MKIFEKIFFFVFALLFFITAIHHFSFEKHHKRINVEYSFYEGVRTSLDNETKAIIEEKIHILYSEGKLQKPLTVVYGTVDDLFEKNDTVYFKVLQIPKTTYLLQQSMIFLTVTLCFLLILMYLYTLKSSELSVWRKIPLSLPIFLFVYPFIQEIFAINDFDITVFAKMFLPFLVMFVFFLVRNAKKELILLFVSMFYMFAPFLVYSYMDVNEYTLFYHE